MFRDRDLALRAPAGELEARATALGWRALGPHVVPVQADLTRSRLGLSPRDLGRVCEETTHVVHAGATVRFDDALHRARQVNASGTREVVELARRMPLLARLVHVSTTFVCGDRASIDKDGYFWFVGRDDDVINTGGHLVGPFEIESALLEHPSVAESAAVAKPDKVNMEVVKAFVALKPGFKGDDDLELEIMNFIRKKLSPLAMPQEIEFVKSLPKTRSGKIMRRVLRAQEFGEPIGDLSTLEND